jgi:hypothetical protein
MNVHKHMEAIFVVALATVGFGTMLIDSVPEADASARTTVMRDVAARHATQGSAPVAVVCAPKAPQRA